MPRPGTVTDRAGAILFLTEAARYFENRDTGGEDRAYWANMYNAENCRNVIKLLEYNPREVSLVSPPTAIKTNTASQKIVKI